MLNVYYRGILDKNHSWGVVATELISALEKYGFTFKVCDPMHKDKWDAKRIDPRLKDKLSKDTSSDMAMSYCVPPNIKALPKTNISHIYNYEYTKLPTGWANLINRQVKLFLPSSSFARDIFIKNGVNPSITEVLPHGIDLNKYNPQIPAQNLNSKKFTFLCVSAPHYRKGLDILLKAFGEEFATIEEVELIIKTQIPKKKAPYELDIRKVLDETRKNIALPRVRVVTEYYPSLAPLYRAAHAYVSPTHSECFGLTELEAVCCGLPVIVTNYGGYLDFLNKDNSFLVNQRPMYAKRNMQYWHYHPKSVCADPDIQDLKNQMRYVFNNYKVAQQKAKRAYEQIAHEYTWDKIAETYIRLAETHGIIPEGKAKSKREVPVGILVPESEPPPNRAKEASKGKNVEALRKSLKKKAQQTIAKTLTEKTSPDKVTISVHAIIYNEENNIVELLENLYEDFDEIVLVDGGSKDETPKLINNFIREHDAKNIKLFVKPQKDKTRYSNKWNQPEQRNFALQQCTSDWVFMIDADERLDVKFKAELKKLAASGRSKAYAFPKYHYWESKDKIRTDGWWFPNYSYRLWKNGERIKYENKARHCQPLVGHLGLAKVLSVKDVKNFGAFSDLPVHHLHYLEHKKNELGLYRANDKDLRSVSALVKGLKTRPVPSVDHVLQQTTLAVPVEVKNASDIEGLIKGAKNVAFVMENFPFYSGGRYHLYQEAYALARAGANVWMITNRVPVYTDDFPKVQNFRICEKWKVPSKVKFDVVVGTPSSCGQRAYNIRRMNKNAKLILVSLETPNFVQEYRGGADSEEKYWTKYKKYMRHTDLVLASAKLPGKYLKHWAGLPDEKIDFMPPAINEFALQRTGKVKKANTLVFISRIVEHKKLDKLLKAIAKIQGSFKNPPILDIIGNGNPEKVQKLLKDTGVKGRFFTNISDVAKFQLIKRAKGLITCSTYEGFGMSPLEGMVCEIPVICSDLPIFHETLGKRVTYFNNENISELANKLETLLRKPDSFRQKIDDAKAWVVKQYSLAEMSNRWKKILANLEEKIPEKKGHKRPIVSAGKERPKVSACIIALNEAEYISYNLKQLYEWDCCHEIIVVEGSVDLYPKERLSPDGLSGDGTTKLIKDFPDPQNKIKYVSGQFKNKIQQRNEYAKRVTGSHAIVVDADEFYSYTSLEMLAEDIILNPKADLFTFNFSQVPSKRTYYHLWYNFRQHVVGGYWDVPHNRIYRWKPGTKYTGTDHNHPAKPGGTKLIKYNVKSAETRAICVHTGFVKSLSNQKDKNTFYVNRGEGKEKDQTLRKRRQMYVDCRRAYEIWKPGDKLPHKAKLLSFDHPLPEALLDHPYMQDPKYLLRLREGGAL